MTTALPFKPYVLTPLDHLIPPIHMFIFMSFKVENPQKGLCAFEAGVSRLVSILPFLTGNVVPSSQLKDISNVFEVQPTNDAFFLEYPMLTVKAHLEKLKPQRTTQRFNASSNHYTFNEKYSPLPLMMDPSEPVPVLRFQANLMEDGILICMAFNHMVMDGYAINTIADALAECCRDPNTTLSSLPNLLNSEHIRRQIFQTRSAMKTTMDEFGQFTADDDTWRITDKPLVSRLSVLDGDKIDRLREACTSLVPELLNTRKHPSSGRVMKKYLSTNDIVSALVWLCVMRAWSRALSKAKKQQQLFPSDFSLLQLVNIRNIVQPAIPDDYMGNALVTVKSQYSVQTAVSAESTGDIVNSSKVTSIGKEDLRILADIALVVRNTVNSLNDKDIRGIISGIADSTDWTVSPLIGNLNISNLRHLKFYEMYFGPDLGHQYHFDLPDNRVSGLGWLLPARFPSSSAPWELRLTLEPVVMEELQKDRLFSWVLLNESPNL